MMARSATLAKPREGARSRRGAMLAPEPWEQEFVSPQGDTLTIKYMFIAPELATVMLNANTANRRPAQKQFEQYQRSMQNNDWMFIGDVIRFADDLLLDGQHRLLAIEKSGVGQWMLVLSGLPKSVQRYIDNLRARTATDQLTIDEVERAGSMATIARLLLKWEAWLGEDGRVITPGNNEVTEFVHQHQYALGEGWDHAVAIYAGVGGGMSKPALAAAFVRAQQVSLASTMPDRAFLASNFFTKVASGLDLKGGDVAYSLRNSYITSVAPSMFVDLYKAVRGWNAEVAGEPLGRLQVVRKGFSVMRIPDMRVPEPEDVSEEYEAALFAQEQLAEGETR